MNNSNKQRALKAGETLYNRYLNQRVDIKLSVNFCPLCQIFDYDSELYDSGKLCAGCPNKIFGLERFSPCYGRLTLRTILKKKPNKYILNAEYWQKALPILENIPAKYFTFRGWRPEPFEPLIALDKEIYDKYMGKK